MIKTIIKAPKGTKRREVDIDKIQVPDLWHIGRYLIEHDNEKAGEQVLECWHLAHDLITNIQAYNHNQKL